MQAGDADVDDELAGASEVAGGVQRLAGDGQVGRARPGDDDELAGGRGWGGRPGQQSGDGVVEGVRQDLQDDLGVPCAGAGEEVGLLGASRDALGDVAELVVRLALAVDRLGVAAAAGAVEVEVGDGVDVVSHGGAPRG